MSTPDQSDQQTRKRSCEGEGFGEGGALRVLPRSFQDDHRLNVRGTAGASSSSSSLSCYAPLRRRDDISSAFTPICADEDVSSPPEAPCRTALPTEDTVRKTEASAPPWRASCTTNSRDAGGGAGSLNSTEASLRQLQRLRWSIDDFHFLGRLGVGRISTVGRFSCTHGSRPTLSR